MGEFKKSTAGQEFNDQDFIFIFDFFGPFIVVINVNTEFFCDFFHDTRHATNMIHMFL